MGITIGLGIFCFVLVVALWFVLTVKIKDNTKAKDEKSKLEYQISNLKLEKDKLNYEQLNTKNDIKNLKEQINIYTENLRQIDETISNSKQRSQEAFESYCDILDAAYKNTEEEYSELEDSLREAYAIAQEKLLAETSEIQKELDKIKATRTAAIEAQIREKKIKEQQSFYCLKISDADIADIQKLENIKKTLNKPRVLSMLIWQTWFQKPLKALAANILGTSTVTGIYKITNIITGECYIGQAADIASRWSEHAKCGLGIDTPAGNKLYKAMQEYGLQSFSWELLEKCDRAELNEKERYYISLYDSVNYGYNILKGNK
mgnify:FL=1